MIILNIKNLSLAFNGKNILNNLNLEIMDGKVFAVVGPNGAGKSTLASTIMVLEGYRNYQGEIFFKKKSLKKLGIYERAKLGMTLGWQEPARYEGLKVSQFLTASSKDKDKNTIVKSMNIAGIDYLTYYSRAVDKSLSGGERKKIELASIVAMQPGLVILDEPDSGIDVASLKNIFGAIKYLRKKGSTIFLITHSLEVLKQAEYAYLMCNGSIIDEGSVEEIKKYFKGKCMPCPHKNIPDISDTKEEVLL